MRFQKERNPWHVIYTRQPEVWKEVILRYVASAALSATDSGEEQEGRLRAVETACHELIEAGAMRPKTPVVHTHSGTVHEIETVVAEPPEWL